MSKKGQQRLYFLRKMVSFSVSPSLLKMFYNSFIESVLTFCIICWFGNVTVEQKSLARKIVSTASKLLGIPVMGLQQIYQTRCLGKAMKIISDNKHPLHNEFELLPSGRRFRIPGFLKNRGEKFFISQAVKFLNEIWVKRYIFYFFFKKF